MWDRPAFHYKTVTAFLPEETHFSGEDIKHDVPDSIPNDEYYSDNPQSTRPHFLIYLHL